MKQKIIPILSVVVGILAGILTHKYILSQEKRVEELLQHLREAAAEIQVVGVANDVPTGSTLTKEDLGVIWTSRRSVGDRAVLPKDANLLLGKKVLFAIEKKKPILWTDIAGGGLAMQGLAPVITPGMRAISLSVGGAASVSGMVNPADRVDVLGTFSFSSQSVPGEMETVTLTVLQDVTVLATGTRMAREIPAARRSRTTSYSTVTLEVTAREAELLVFAQQMKGRLTLSLRNPNDVSFEQDLPVINFEHLENKLPDLNRHRQRFIRHKKNL